MSKETMTKDVQFEPLKNPPAIEAVLDISVNEVAHFNLEKLHVKGKDKPFNREFPKKEIIGLIEGAFSKDPAANQQNGFIRNRQLGYSYKSADDKAICQFRVNGFSYNHLQPYPGWDTFVGEGIKNWNIYQNLHKRAQVTRIGLRFINLIAVNDTTAKLEKYFNVVLSTPTNLPSPKQQRYQYIVDFPELSCMGIVNFGGPEENGSFVLDIDIIKQNLAGPLAESDLLQYLKEMREAKNDIFFSTLTSHALKAYR